MEELWQGWAYRSGRFKHPRFVDGRKHFKVRLDRGDILPWHSVFCTDDLQEAFNDDRRDDSEA